MTDIRETIDKLDEINLAQALKQAAGVHGTSGVSGEDTARAMMAGGNTGTIEKWAIVEYNGHLVVGGVKDGQKIKTSPIVAFDVKKRQIETHSGSVYILGDPGFKWK